MGLFMFLLGAVSSLLLLFVLLVNFINKAEEKIQKEYDDAKALEEPDLQKVPLDDKKVQVQVEAIGSADAAEWLYGIVRANMVFLFKAELDVSASGVFCLDGAKIAVLKNNIEQSSPWHKKNPIQVTCPERNLLHQSNTLLFYCKSAREAENWYYSIARGANLSVKKDALTDQKARKEHSHFKLLHTILKNADFVSMSPAVSPASSPAPSPSPSPPIPHSTTPVSHSVHTPLTHAHTISHSSHTPPTLTRTASGSTLPTSASTAVSPISSPNPQDSKIHSHLTWLNALLSRMFWNIHDAPDFSAFLTRKFNKKLLKIKKPSILKTVAICNVSFGPNLPMITSAHLDHIGAAGEVVVSGELQYFGGFTLTVSIEIFIEVMGHSLTVPVMVTARVTSLHGRAVVCIPAPPSCRVWFAFEREPTCEIDVDTAFGTAGKVANIPRIAKIAVNALKTEMLKIIVLPNMEDFQLPKFKGQKGDKGVVNLASTVKSESTPIPPAPSVLTKGNSPSNSATQFDHKMIDEALENLAKKVQDPPQQI